ncbi:hypothetical protein SACC_08040 [Saccharolobus caldissimus]|uniref:Uncharacterized protein n=1 Tax=Saccharolobus caldissimus TaxID=1702097 RepID=A0AAQ4CPQ6_9CREN|nr:hypothetical protein SACC_08040 [Saccharolobus caldissimus]
MLLIQFNVISLIFFVYGILSPIYFEILRNKISNEKLFLIAWTSAPHLVGIIYSTSFLAIVIIILSLIFNLAFIYKNMFKIIYSGSTFLLMSIIIQIFINPFNGLYK